MKTAKKLFASLLAVVMALALAVPAFAVGDDNEGGGETTNPIGSITITNPISETVYSVYRIFDLKSYRAPAEGSTDDKGAYLYTVNQAWTGFIETDDATAYVSVDDETGYVTWVGDVTDSRVAEFAQKALAYAKENSISSVGDSKTADNSDSSIVFSQLPLGYYLVDSSLGALCALTTTDPTATVTEKNQKPTVDKEITDTTPPGVGDTVHYQVKITVQAGAENYVLTDKMSAGLNFDTNSVSIKVNNADVNSNNYTTYTTATSDYTFKIEFKNEYIASLVADTEIIVTYSATITQDAVVRGADNTATLNYGNETDTPHSTSSVAEPTLVNLTINKVDGASKTTTDEVDTYSTYLGGAEFILYKTVTEDEAEVTKYATVSNGVLTGWTDSEGGASKLTTASDGDNIGQVTVSGLAAGTYSLKEVKAPDGYNKLEESTVVTITVIPGENGNKPTITGNDVTVENNAGTVLPSTGGIGTTIFYVVGGVLIVGAVVLLVTRKRMRED